MRNLFPYQEYGRDFLAERRHAGLFDGMRLGKTRQALAAARKIHASSVLVVCKASGIANWVREAREWGFRTFRVSDQELALPGFEKPTVVVASYNAIIKPAVHAVLMRRYWTVLIADEAHALKNRNSQRTQAVYGLETDTYGGLAGRAGCVWLLTGTPMVNWPDELWPHARALFPHRFKWSGNNPMTYWQFRERFCQVRRDAMGGETIVDGKNLDELKKRMQGQTLRRTKEEVWTQVPPTIVSMLSVQCKFPKVPPEEYKQVKRALDLDSDDEILKALENSHIATLRRLTGLAKARAVGDWVRDYLEDTDEKIILFAHHRDVIETLKTAIYPYKPTVIDGRLRVDEREWNRREFQSDPERRVLIGQNHAAGDSIALWAANTTLMIEPDWTPGQNAQCLERMIHHDKFVPCSGYYVTIADSIDEHIMKVLLRKSGVHEEMGL